MRIQQFHCQISNLLNRQSHDCIIHIIVKVTWNIFKRQTRSMVNMPWPGTITCPIANSHGQKIAQSSPYVQTSWAQKNGRTYLSKIPTLVVTLIPFVNCKENFICWRRILLWLPPHWTASTLHILSAVFSDSKHIIGYGIASHWFWMAGSSVYCTQETCSFGVPHLSYGLVAILPIKSRHSHKQRKPQFSIFALKHPAQRRCHWGTSINQRRYYTWHQPELPIVEPTEEQFSHSKTGADENQRCLRQDVCPWWGTEISWVPFIVGNGYNGAKQMCKV